MILLRNYFINTTQAVDVISVIHEVNRTVTEAGVSEGLVTILVPGPGGGLAVIEPLPDIVSQFKAALKIFPGEGVETKTRSKESVSVGPRVVQALLGRSLSIPLAGGRLALSHREEPMLIDMDSRGIRREFLVQVMGDSAQAGQAGQAGPARPAQRPRR